MEFIKNFFLLSSLSLLLIGCASSNISDSAATQVDNTYLNTTSAIDHIGENGIDTYPNTSGVVQGAAVGATVGALAAGLKYSSVSTGLVGGAVGLIAGGVLGAYLNHNASLVAQLENHGAKVFILGDQVLIIVPAGQVFRDTTPNIYPEADNTLNLIAKLVRGYKTIGIKVAVYADGEGPDRVNQPLTQEQADSVVKYLWPRVNTRLLYGVGYGNTNLVQPVGGAMNARIEITLEKLPA